MIETSAPRAGVVGWPIEHSRSPTIHRYWLKELGIPGDYEKFAVRPEEFRQFADKIGKDGFLAPTSPRLTRKPLLKLATAGQSRRGSWSGQHLMARRRTAVGRQHRRCRIPG